MKIKIAFLMSLVLVISALTIYSSGKSQQNTVAEIKDQNIQNHESKLLVFINPNGRPCQIQMSILESMKTKLEKVAKVEYVSTTESTDRKLFYKFGIRALPSMIIVDDSENEIERFTPGIHDEVSVMSAFSQLKNKGN